MIKSIPIFALLLALGLAGCRHAPCKHYVEGNCNITDCGDEPISDCDE